MTQLKVATWVAVFIFILASAYSNGIQPTTQEGENQLGDGDQNNTTLHEAGYHVPPYFKVSDADAQLTVVSPAGRTVKLACKVSGRPQPQVAWEKDGQVLTKNTVRSVGGSYKIRSSTLEIEDANTADSGKYTCEAFNANNRNYDIRSTFNVTIVDRLRTKPIIVPNVLLNQTVDANTTANFTCKVISDLAPHIIWMRVAEKNGSFHFWNQTTRQYEMNFTDMRTVETAEVIHSNSGSSTLRIHNVTKEDEGMYACLTGNSLGITQAMALLKVNEKGADVDARDADGLTPLHKAVENGHKETVLTLLDKGADVNATTSRFSETPLHYAARNGHKEIVLALLDKGADVDARDGGDQTPLHKAALNGHKETVLALLDKGADINAREFNGRTPLDWAAKNGHKEIALALLDKGADCNATDWNNGSSLHWAVEYGHKEMVSALLNKGADVGARDFNGWTPLDWAAKNGHKEIALALLDKGADVDARHVHGRTPLHRAAVNGHKETVLALLDKGADVNARDEHGRTPLHLAAVNGHKETILTLLGKGADTNAKDISDNTPLDTAESYLRYEVVSVLRSNGTTLR